MTRSNPCAAMAFTVSEINGFQFRIPAKTGKRSVFASWSACTSVQQESGEKPISE